VLEFELIFLPGSQRAMASFRAVLGGFHQDVAASLLILAAGRCGALTQAFGVPPVGGRRQRRKPQGWPWYLHRTGGTEFVRRKIATRAACARRDTAGGHGERRRIEPQFLVEEVAAAPVFRDEDSPQLVNEAQGGLTRRPSSLPTTVPVCSWVTTGEAQALGQATRK